MAKKILITGGCGFIGSHFVRLILTETDWEIVNVDLLTYAGNPENVADVSQNPRYTFVQADIADTDQMSAIWARGFDYVAHFAAETHVDNSIANASPFVRTNVLGTQILLDLAKNSQVEKFLYVSTDEVYGDLSLDAAEKFTEESPLKPSSPYSASKAGGDLLTQAYHRTYGLPTLITRCSNNYGTHQFPEKLVPFFVQKLLRNEKLPVYGDGKNVREWLAVEDHCRAVKFVLEQGKIGEIYNVGSNNEKNNLEIAKLLCDIFEKKFEDTVDFVKDRPGHDRRYALDSSKLRALGWSEQENFEKHFREVVDWYRDKFSV